MRLKPNCLRHPNRTAAADADDRIRFFFLPKRQGFTCLNILNVRLYIIEYSDKFSHKN